jgi:hypothetical protein
LQTQWEIPCDSVEEMFQSGNQLSEQVKITGAEFDEMADAIYITIEVSPEDYSVLPNGTTHSVEKEILILEMANSIERV